MTTPGKVTVRRAKTWWYRLLDLRRQRRLEKRWKKEYEAILKKEMEPILERIKQDKKLEEDLVIIEVDPNFYEKKHHYVQKETVAPRNLN